MIFRQILWMEEMLQFGGYHLIGFQHISTILLLVQKRQEVFHPQSIFSGKTP
jgi:hypothetical protein